MNPFCDPWIGSPQWFQHEARQANNLNDPHLWVTTTCDTPMCLVHVRGVRPVALDYMPGICVYCGLDSDTKDHLVPRGWSGDAKRSWVLTVPACRECNTAIGAQWAPTLNERRDVAHVAIRRRYRKHLVGSTLSDQELSEYGPNLRSMLVAHQRLREVTRGRLAWPGAEAYDVVVAARSGIENPYAIGLLREPR